MENKITKKNSRCCGADMIIEHEDLVCDNCYEPCLSVEGIESGSLTESNLETAREFFKKNETNNNPN